MSGDDYERPDSVPKEGQVPAFDAGWNGHRLGLERDTIAALAPPSAVGWALLGWDVRCAMAAIEEIAESVAVSPNGTPEPADDTHQGENQREARVRIAASALVEHVHRHEVDHHDGDPCVSERINMLAYVAHRLGIVPPDDDTTDAFLEMLRSRVLDYDSVHEEHVIEEDE